ncbi:MAG: hypothetical protein GNW80_16870 [Asgard group archaeon]|nr:hypothetical protein [Asgard group archaeon]
MKGILSNFQDKAHTRHRKLLVLSLLTIIVLCFSIAPIQLFALESSENNLESVSPMTIIPEFNQLDVGFERDYLFKIANIGEYQDEFNNRNFDVHDNLIFHAAGKDGLLIYDTTNPQDIKLISQITDFHFTNSHGIYGYIQVCYSEGYVYA